MGAVSVWGGNKVSSSAGLAAAAAAAPGYRSQTPGAGLTDISIAVAQRSAGRTVWRSRHAWIFGGCCGCRGFIIIIIIIIEISRKSVSAKNNVGRPREKIEVEKIESGTR